jgi:hypothetical protein
MIYLSAWIDQHASIISSQNQSVLVTCGRLDLEMTPNEQQVSVCYSKSSEMAAIMVQKKPLQRSMWGLHAPQTLRLTQDRA